MAVTPVERWLLDAVVRRGADFAEQLRSVPDTSVQVPNLEWSVADLAQHVASLPWHFRDLHDAGQGFDAPADWAAWSKTRRTHVTETDPGLLADMIDSEFADIVTELGTDPGPRWFYGFEAPPSTIAAMLVNEAVMHGRDLAGVTGAKPPTLEPNEAHAAANATMLSTHIFIDAEKTAQQPNGVYHVKFRGGKDFTWTKSGAELIITEGKPAKADAHLNADAAMFMLSSLGRVSQVAASLSGKMITYGWKPWRFLGLGNIAAEGI